MAQAMSDLNALVLQAGRYAAHESAAQGPHQQLELFRIIGGSGGEPGSLMHKAVDVQMWTLIYQIDPADATAGAPAGLQPGDISQSVSVQCVRGLFNAMVWSPLPVFDAKSLQWAWFALSLDDAVAQLNREGYTRGFSSVTLVRPMHPHISDECTFVFRCPPDHAYVGISAETGEKLWTESFPY
jgi:hypothetical protein